MHEVIVVDPTPCGNGLLAIKDRQYARNEEEALLLAEHLKLTFPVMRVFVEIGMFREGEEADFPKPVKKKPEQIKTGKAVVNVQPKKQVKKKVLPKKKKPPTKKGKRR